MTDSVATDRGDVMTEETTQVAQVVETTEMAEAVQATAGDEATDSTATGKLQLLPYEPHHGFDINFFKSRTNPNTRPYTFLEDQSWVGIPLFLSGLIAKSEKTAFRQDYNNPNTKIRLIKTN